MSTVIDVSQVVLESNGASYYAASADSNRRIEYTLVAFNDNDTAIKTTSFTVAPREKPQLVAAIGTAVTPPSVSVPLDNIGQDILVQIEGSQVDRLSSLVNTLAEEVASGGVAMPLPYRSIALSLYRSIEKPRNRETENGNVVASMQSVSFRLRAGYSQIRNRYSLSINGQYHGRITSGAQVTVSTDPEFSGAANLSSQTYPIGPPSEPLNGRMRLRSDTGDDLFMTAEPQSLTNSQTPRPQVTFVFVKSSGESTTTTGVQLLQNYNV